MLGLLPVLLTIDVIVYTIHGGHIDAIDFHHEFWPASQRVVHGLSPYDMSWQYISGGVAFPYPALTALVFVPFALLPHALADAVITVINLAAALLILRVLNVRDWRLYGLVLLWSPVVNAWQTANLTLLLALGVAFLWRERDRPVIAGTLVALLISLKPFIWPLALWLLVTRRFVAAIYAVISGLILNVICWAVLGFDQLHSYQQVVQAVTHVMVSRGYSVMALAIHLGAHQAVAYAIGYGLVAVVVAAAIRTGARGDARGALCICIAVSLLATPVLWTHYFVLMIVPLALGRPRLERLWLLPLLLWACPAVRPAGWQIVVALLVNAIVVCQLVRRPDPDGAEAQRAAQGLRPAQKLPARRQRVLA